MSAATGNPVDDQKFTGPLIRALHGHVDAMAETVAYRPPHQPPKGNQAQRDHKHRIAAAWVFQSCLAVWAEDHGLTGPFLRRCPITRPAGHGLIVLGRAFESLARHPATQWVQHPAYNPLLWAGAPDPATADALIDWWAGDAPSLAYATTTGPTSISGWVVGDLLQALSKERVKENAFCQTPWWVADAILDLTLIPACAEFVGDEPLRLIDPTAGTGHLLLRAVDYLWEWYTTGTLKPRQTHTSVVATREPVPPAEAARRILAGVDGVELDPLCAAVARLRVAVYVGHLMYGAGLVPDLPRLIGYEHGAAVYLPGEVPGRGTLRLVTIPAAVLPRVAVGDSLLLGSTDRAEYGRLHPDLVDLPGAAFPLADFDWSRPADPAAVRVSAPEQPALF